MAETDVGMGWGNLIYSTLRLDTGNLTDTDALICFMAAIILGVAISLVYMYTTPAYTKNFAITIAILPSIVQAVLILVNGNLGTSVAVMGIFTLVRFRSVPGSSKEIMAVFLTTAIGLAIGMGFLGYAVVITVISGAVFVVLSKTRFGEKKYREKLLRVTMPENLDYTHVFDDIFDKYLNKCTREKTKTVNMGTMYQISYIIEMKDVNEEKKLIDDIRCRNGNLTVSIGRVPVNTDEL